MGANEDYFVIKGGNRLYVKNMVEQKSKDDAYEFGHGGYTGTFAEWNGGIDFCDYTSVFKDFDAAHFFIFGGEKGKKYIEGKAKKWGNVVAVQFRNEKGQINWLVGGVFSC